MGLKYVLWVAPFMVGSASRMAQEMAEHLLPNEFMGFMGFRSLCPRNPQVREHVTRTLLRLMGDYGVDGFKLDFGPSADRQSLDGFLSYTQTAAHRGTVPAGKGQRVSARIAARACSSSLFIEMCFPQ